ncbi:hypothetical protein ASG87_15050 [Frateuria sp. Soil773]|nr:hypothetical protein ASG87_15050 [Frateuria sp. Soil773]
MLAGEWRGDEQIATTPWGAGGPAVGHVVARLDLGGRVLLQDYREEREGKPSLQAHAVLAAGAADGEYALYWFDSYGFVPERPAPGHRDGDRLVFLRSSPRGQTRHTYLLQDASSYRLTLDCSFDGGVQWERLMSGDYRRVG